MDLDILILVGGVIAAIIVAAIGFGVFNERSRTDRREPVPPPPPSGNGQRPPVGGSKPTEPLDPREGWEPPELPGDGTTPNGDDDDDDDEEDTDERSTRDGSRR